MALTCVRRDCASFDADLTSPHNHGIDPSLGLETCLCCGSYLGKRSITAMLNKAREGADPEPWEGSWTKDGDSWAIRLWMPDNDHREDEPEEGHEVRITTRAGKVQIVRLGRLLESNRKSMTFAAPERK